MNGDLALEVQTSIFSLLVNDPTLLSAGYLNGPNVFDHIPDNSPPNFICLDDAEYADGGDKTDPGQQGMFYVRCWTREKGNKVGLTIARRVVALLHEQPLVLQSGFVTVLRLSSSGTRRDPDGVSRQAYRVFRIIVSE
jgi:Protein of unknown function (DUF3168)